MFYILLCVGEKNILYVCKLYYFYIWLNDILYIRAKIILISNLMVVNSPLLWMNIVIYGVLIVERVINICGIRLIYVVIYIRLKY